MNEENTTNDQNLSEEEKPVTDTNDENTSVPEADKLKKQLAELNDKYLRLYSEFDNFRKRTLKEKSELIKTASEDVLRSVLPVIDDFERAMKANENVEEVTPIKEGIALIYNKLKNSTQLKGLTAFESVGQDFNSDTMEAITHIPATDENQKGKVVDEIEKGYKLGDKVIRYAKVVVAN
jgi:molecular chaperone GrpE